MEQLWPKRKKYDEYACYRTYRPRIWVVHIDFYAHSRYHTARGPVAQLVERHYGIVEVVGSSPIGSTNTLIMLIEFKQFLLRGNVVDLAVGVVVGAAFGSVVSALVSDILTPLIAAIAKVPDFGMLTLTLNGSKFMYGHFINAMISFLLVASAVFFFVVKPMNVLTAHSRKESSTKPCAECLSDIPLGAKRCKYCAQAVGGQ